MLVTIFNICQIRKRGLLGFTGDLRSMSSIKHCGDPPHSSKKALASHTMDKEDQRVSGRESGSRGVRYLWIGPATQRCL